MSHDGRRAPRSPRSARRPVAVGRTGSRRAEPRIVYVDDDLIVVDKPAGMQTARVPSPPGGEARDPGPGRAGGPDLVTWLRERSRTPELAGRRPQAAGRRVGPWSVRRLDRDVSGLVIFARTRRALNALRAERGAMPMALRYLALVRGELEPGREGVIESWLSAGPGPVRSSPVSADRTPVPAPEPGPEGARFARTRYRVRLAGGGCSLLEVHGETRHRHQLRVHLQQIGHPVIGDRIYGDGARGPRLCLHAASLRFAHPGNGRRIELQSDPPAALTAPLGLAARALQQALARDAAPPRRARPGPARAAREAPTHWDAVAEWYDALIDEEGSDHYRDVILPGVLRLLDAQPGQRALDIACGQGVLCRALASLGVRALGIDASERLIARARERAQRQGPPPDYRIADARALETLGDGPFDAASCVLALSNIDPIEPVLCGAARLLRPGAPLVIALAHPAFRAPRQSAWGWERDARGSEQQYRRVDAYLSRARVPIVANPGGVASGEAPVETWTFHRPIGAYVRALADAGFALDRLEEWASQRTSQPGPRAAEENRARREIPLFLGLRARRLGSPA